MMQLITSCGSLRAFTNQLMVLSSDSVVILLALLECLGTVERVVRRQVIYATVEDVFELWKGEAG